MGPVLWPSRRGIGLAASAIAGVVVCGVLIGPVTASDPEVVEEQPVVAQVADRGPTDEIQYDAPTREEKAVVRTALERAELKEEQADIELGPGGIPPASAGDNGTFDEAPTNRRGISALTTGGINGLPPARSATLLGRTAIAPPGAPEEVEQAISAANAIVGAPYVWGGGHASWNDNGYDCSGAVSYALGGAGLLGAPVNSTALMDWGEPGPGKWITVYANPSHTYAVIAGLRWDTSGEQRGTGPKWFAEPPYPKGYVVRHPAGL